MTWIAILVVAVAAFVLAAFALRLPRKGWTLFAAALMFGLAGYAMQGSASQPSSPAATRQQSIDRETGEAMVAARRALFDPNQPPPGFITLSDGFARQGQYDDAAGLLRAGLAINPTYAEGWVALALALVEHADGQLTPASLYAFAQAEEAAPGHPGSGYFLGIALLRSGRPAEARALWAELLEASPPDAPWRAELAARTEQLDQMLAQMQAIPADTPPAP